MILPAESLQPLANVNPGTLYWRMIKKDNKSEREKLKIDKLPSSLNQYRLNCTYFSSRKQPLINSWGPEGDEGMAVGDLGI